MKLNNKQTTRGRTSGAFTLVELMIGVVIIGIAAIGLYGGLTYSFDMVKSTREEVRATQIMQDKVEAIRLCNWDQINTTGFIPSYFSEPYYPMGGVTNGGLTYLGRIEVATVSNSTSYEQDLRLITVSVKWTSGGLERNRQLQTMVARYGLQNYVF